MFLLYSLLRYLGGKKNNPKISKNMIEWRKEKPNWKHDAKIDKILSDRKINIDRKFTLTHFEKKILSFPNIISR
jgi:hypothetical protein